MSYVIEVTARAARVLEAADTHIRASFLQIVALLEQDPLPSPEFRYIRAYYVLEGSPLLIYFDGVFPYVVEYRAYPLDASTGGFVRILDLREPDDIPPDAIVRDR